MKRGRRNRSLLPKDYYESTLDWVDNTSVIKEEVLYEIYPEIPIPKVIREEESQLLLNKQKYSNKAFVVNMPYGRVLGERAVISPDNKLLWDVSVEWSKWPREHSIFKESTLPPLNKADKTIALLTHPAANNYYHWILEALARIHLIEQTGIHIDEYIVNHKSLSFQIETLPIFGIDPAKIIQPDENFHIEARNLVVPSYVNLPNLWSCNYVRNMLLSHKSLNQIDGYERIYIERKNYRKVVNEEELVPVLDNFGFKRVALETLSVQQQVDIFYNAKVIISPHGAGLANLIFCKPGTKVIELFTPSFMEPHYWLISRLLHLEYHMIVGSRENPYQYWSGFDNLSINHQLLSNLLTKIIK